MKYGAINIDPEILGGTPVFTGTRVPIQSLFDYLEGGDSLEEFLDDFPSVTKKQTIEVLEQTRKIKSDLKEAFEDVDKMKAGKIKKQTLTEFLNNL